MPGDGIAASGSIRCRPPYDVDERSIRLDEIEIRSSDIVEFVSEISHEGHALQENFRQGNRRTNIQIDPAAIHPPHKLRQQPKISVRRCAQRCPIGFWMEVTNVATNCDMSGERDSRPVGAAQ